jgi:uncharacterized protein with ParB-like and HNH nuclease domain
MDNGQKEINVLFDGRKIFCIPNYQRSYAWTEKQLKDFLEDIKNQRDDKDYFFGTILFKESGQEEDFHKIDIVDGQQRMTTIIIFMRVLIDYLRENGEETEILEGTYLKKYNKVKFRIQESDNEFFQTYILEDNKNARDAIKTPSQRKLLFAKEYFHKEIIPFLRNKEVLLKFKKRIESAKLLTYSVLDEADASLIFETTNDRGKPLTNLEKIKSFLMYKTYLASREEIPRDLLQKIFARFSEIYRTLEKIESKIDEDSILQYHFISFEEWDKKRDYQNYLIKIKEKINNMLSGDNGNETLEYIDQYSKQVKETFDIIFNLINDKKENLRDLFLLQRIGVFYPLLIKTYIFDSSEGKYNFLKIAKILEIFSFRILSLKIKRTNDVDSYLHKLANSFKGDYNFLISELKSKIINLAPDNIIKSKLSSPNFYNEFVNNDINYLFWKYENYLRSNGNAKYGKMSEQEFADQDSKYKLSIEHIASQNPRVTKENMQFENMDQNFEENYLHLLGNLTLDPQSSNSSKSNKSVPEKESKYFRKAPFMTQNELEDFMEGERWTKNSINKRKEKIINFALKHWNPEGGFN